MSESPTVHRRRAFLRAMDDLKRNDFTNVEMMQLIARLFATNGVRGTRPLAELKPGPALETALASEKPIEP